MTVHAFADESRRGSTYLIAVALTEPGELRQLRRNLRSLLLCGQTEVHFHNEKEPRRRALANAIARLPVAVRIYTRSCGRQDEPARQDCLAQVIRDLLDRSAHRLVLDSRSHRDTHDEATIRRVIAQHPHPVPLVYEHVGSTSEAMLWIPDAVAWCFARGGQWRTRIGNLIDAVNDLDYP
ncbi:MAG TPA: hypothetical protein VFV67_34960 [Actinophytocola sp.]|uniref:hypothetical protein n=1 Tax=Actinophytocola sp. TaxID=1872138 RepID=UPI002DBBBA0E|nr:hypothetical protein [Actinophytocola sp.]HEU5475867.1 hypothetical protein [Actinophytocola sp.]